MLQEEKDLHEYIIHLCNPTQFKHNQRDTFVIPSQDCRPSSDKKVQLVFNFGLLHFRWAKAAPHAETWKGQPMRKMYFD